jgi:hypothetical protein
MGIDYVRFRTSKPESELRELVNRQAMAAQSMWGWHVHADPDHDLTRYKLMVQVHQATYHSVCESLEPSLEFAVWDEAAGAAADIPDLEWSWRIAVISDNPIFPPLWRVQSKRTILPSELSGQLDQWRTWAEEVTRGLHEPYVRRLLLHHDSDFLSYHWSYLRSMAESTSEKEANWARTPEIKAVREQILRIPVPPILAAPLVPTACEDKVSLQQHDELQRLTSEIKTLTRAWNYHARSNYRLSDYRSSYHATVDEFRREAASEWLTAFFAWGQRCCDERFGLYFDY